MKIKDGYMLRNVAGSYVVVPMGKEAADFNGMITLNETGAFLWKMLERERTPEELAQALQREYEVSAEQAQKSVLRFLEKLKENHFAED